MRKLRSSASTPAAASSSAVGAAGNNASASGSAPGSHGGSLEGVSPSLAGAANASAAATTDSPPDSPHTQLGLMHLKKLFNEYTHPKEPLNETERDFKLYNMLPLFCKVREGRSTVTAYI